MCCMNIEIILIFLCSTLINYCIDASREPTPMNRHTGKDVPGWDEMVKPEREREREVLLLQLSQM